jgi:hypothetical protein
MITEKHAFRSSEMSRLLSPNKPLQRSGVDKVLGRGRVGGVLEQVLRARVLGPQWPAAERSRYTVLELSCNLAGTDSPLVVRST